MKKILIGLITFFATSLVAILAAMINKYGTDWPPLWPHPKQDSTHGVTVAKSNTTKNNANLELDTFEYALKIYLNGSFSQSFEEFQKIRLTDSRSLYYLGRMYSKGEGVAMDTQLARKYYLNAIHSGDSKAYFGLGELVLQEDTLAEDKDSVNMYFSSSLCAIASASENNIYWKTVKSYMYLKGYGWAMNPIMGDSLLTNIKDSSYGWIKYLIAENCLLGRGHWQDTPSALRYF